MRENVEHGVLFAAPMVRAILAGNKSQTRRRVTPFTSFVDGSFWNQPAWQRLNFDDAFLDPGPSPAGNPGPYLKVFKPSEESRHRVYPRWFVGDRLWVRETWAPYDQQVIVTKEREGIIYRADADPRYADHDGPWRPSLHMPRWASRITLQVVKVRVERLQDLTDADAKAEGFPLPPMPALLNGEPATVAFFDAILGFRALWDVVTPRGARWDDNPHVWAYDFERVIEPSAAREATP